MQPIDQIKVAILKLVDNGLKPEQVRQWLEDHGVNVALPEILDTLANARAGSYLRRQIALAKREARSSQLYKYNPPPIGGTETGTRLAPSPRLRGQRNDC